jgi:2-dehydropantoate 2-reductase
MVNVAYLGMGAIGCTFASQMKNTNYNIQVICDGERKERYKNNKFSINDIDYIFDYKSLDEFEESPDLLIISVKYHDLREAIKGIDKIIDKNTIVISLLNGIDSEEIIAEQIGEDNLLYSFVYSTDATKVGKTFYYKNNGIIFFGEKSGEITEKAKRLKKIFEDNDIRHDMSTNIIRDMWFKYMINIGFNQPSAVLGAPYGVFRNNQNIREIGTKAMLEVVTLANKLGIDLSMQDIQDGFDVVDNFAADGRTSMLQDVNAKRITEIDMFAGKFCEIAKKHGVPCPVNEMLYHMVKVIEYKY